MTSSIEETFKRRSNHFHCTHHAFVQSLVEQETRPSGVRQSEKLLPLLPRSWCREAVSSSQVCSNDQGRLCLKNIFSVINSQMIHLSGSEMRNFTLPGRRGAPSLPEASLKAGVLACQKKPCSIETAEVKPEVWGSPAQMSVLGAPPSVSAMLPWVLKDSLLSEFIHRTAHHAMMLQEGWPPFWDENGLTCFRRC